MGRIKIDESGTGYPNRNALYSFTDDSKLLIIPERETFRLDPVPGHGSSEIVGFDQDPQIIRGIVIGFKASLLYNDRKIRALVLSESDNGDPGFCFWSEGVSQKTLADYLDKVVEWSDSKYEKYTNREIDYKKWRKQFWESWVISNQAKGIIEPLRNGGFEILPENPGFPENLEELSL